MTERLLAAESWAAKFAGFAGLPEPFPLTPRVLLEQDAAQLLEPRGRVNEREKDRLAFVNFERKHPRLLDDGALQLGCQLFVIDLERQCADEVVADADTSEEHAPSVQVFAS